MNTLDALEQARRFLAGKAGDAGAAGNESSELSYIHAAALIQALAANLAKEAVR